jgi:hypothetical protein
MPKQTVVGPGQVRRPPSSTPLNSTALGPEGIFDAPLPTFIRPQLVKLVTEAPESERGPVQARIKFRRFENACRRLRPG